MYHARQASTHKNSYAGYCRGDDEGSNGGEISDPSFTANRRQFLRRDLQGTRWTPRADRRCWILNWVYRLQSAMRLYISIYISGSSWRWKILQESLVPLPTYRGLIGTQLGGSRGVDTYTVLYEQTITTCTTTGSRQEAL